MTLPDACPCCSGSALPLRAIQRWYIEKVLHDMRGNKTRAIALLRMSRTSLYRYLHRWRREDEAAAELRALRQRREA